MSARHTVPGLDVRRPIGHMLPAMFHDDELAQRWCAGLDDVVAPVPATVENFWAYLEPALAPLDFVEWLSTWVGLELDQTWTEPRRRELVASAHSLHDARGTARGLADLIELYTGSRPEISDGGGVRWSAVPDADLPGGDDPELVVRLRVADPDAVDRDRLEQMVTLAKPAHVRHRIEIERGDPADAAAETAPPPPPPPPPSSSPPPPPPAAETDEDDRSGELPSDGQGSDGPDDADDQGAEAGSAAYDDGPEAAGDEA